MLNKFFYFIILSLFLLLCSCDNNLTNDSDTETHKIVAIKPPFLTFSDLISGPSKGIGDGLGSGVIVTVWGFNLGPEQGSSSIEFCDKNSNCSPVAHIYYWKNADGMLPSGPANLFASHGLQEISFSIPESANGKGKIKIIMDNGDSSLPFTIRDGNIYHVTSQGNDENGDGSFQNPWLTVAKADSTINAGSTLYVHNIITGEENTSLVIYNNRLDAMSSLEAQYSYIAYPNTRPEAIGERGFTTYRGSANITAGFVISKFSIYAAEADEDDNNQPINVRANVSYGIQGTRDGRAIANYITDAHPNDLSGACPDAQQAAIIANSLGTDHVSNFKVFGNHIKDYGCNGTSRFQHTTYFSIRSGSDNEQLKAPEVAWNFLQDNKAISGLHYFDENFKGENCGQFITKFKIHDNVVINQAGAAISFGANCPINTTFDYYNNIAINVGLKADFDDKNTNGSINSAVAISIGHTDVTSELNFKNNIFYNWNSDNQQKNLMSCIGLSAKYNNAIINWNDNVCYTTSDLYFIRSNYLGNSMESKFSGRDNVWHTASLLPFNAITPYWDRKPITDDPVFSIKGTKIIVSADSPLINESESTILRDIYGQLRKMPSTIGAVEYIQK